MTDIIVGSIWFVLGASALIIWRWDSWDFSFVDSVFGILLSGIFGVGSWLLLLIAWLNEKRVYY